LEKRATISLADAETLLKLVDIRFQLRQMRRKSQGTQRASRILRLLPHLNAAEIQFVLRHLAAETRKSYTTSFTYLLRRLLPALDGLDAAGVDQSLRTWIEEMVFYIGRTQSARNEKDLLKKLMTGDYRQLVEPWIREAIAEVIDRGNLERFREFKEWVPQDTWKRLSIKLGRYAHFRSYQQGKAYIDQVAVVRKKTLERNIDGLLRMGSVSPEDADHLKSLLHIRYAINRLKNWSEPTTHKKTVFAFLDKRLSDEDASFLIRHLNHAITHKYNGCFTGIIKRLMAEDRQDRIYIDKGAIKLWLSALIAHSGEVRGADDEVALVKTLIRRYGTECVVAWSRQRVEDALHHRESARTMEIQAYIEMTVEDGDFTERAKQIEEKAEERAATRGWLPERPYTTAEKALAKEIAECITEILEEETIRFTVPWEMIRNRLEMIEEKYPTLDMDRAVELSGFGEELGRRRAADEAESADDYILQASDYGIWDYQEQFYRATAHIDRRGWEEEE